MVTSFRPQIGKHIWVNLPGLQPLEAVVRRADGNNYGCEFVHPLHVSVAQHLQVKLRDQYAVSPRASPISSISAFTRRASRARPTGARKGDGWGKSGSFRVV